MKNGCVKGTTTKTDPRLLPKLSDNERKLLLAMNEHCSAEYDAFGGKACYSFKALASFCPDVPIRRTVRALARKNLTGYERGLTNEDGDMMGAGYGITQYGRSVARQIVELEQ
jgi:hypothetical protein